MEREKVGISRVDKNSTKRMRIKFDSTPTNEFQERTKYAEARSRNDGAGGWRTTNDEDEEGNNWLVKCENSLSSRVDVAEWTIRSGAGERVGEKIAFPWRGTKNAFDHPRKMTAYTLANTHTYAPIYNGKRSKSHISPLSKNNSVDATWNY